MKMLRKTLVLLLVITMMVSVIPIANAATVRIGTIIDTKGAPQIPQRTFSLYFYEE